MKIFPLTNVFLCNTHSFHSFVTSQVKSPFRIPYKTCSRFDTSPKENSPWETYGFPWEKLCHLGRRRRLPRDLTSPKGKKQTEPTSPKEPSNQTICTSPKGLPPNYTNVSQDDKPNHLYISHVTQTKPSVCLPR